jgi:ribonuclease HIII
MGELIDLIKRLIDAVKRLLSLKCECMDEQTYNEVVKELQDTIAMLDDWMKKATGGVIGKEYKEPS